jgi:hypothetical protein
VIIPPLEAYLIFEDHYRRKAWHSPRYYGTEPCGITKKVLYRFIYSGYEDELTYNIQVESGTGLNISGKFFEGKHR